MKLLNLFNDSSILEETTYHKLKLHRMNVAKQIMGKMGDRVTIEPGFFCVWGCNIFVEDGVYMDRKYTSPPAF
jgi:hypothetical protein